MQYQSINKEIGFNSDFLSFAAKDCYSALENLCRNFLT